MDIDKIYAKMVCELVIILDIELTDDEFIAIREISRKYFNVLLLKVGGILEQIEKDNK